MTKLYVHPVSPYSRKAIVAATHQRDPISIVTVNPFAGDLQSEAFLKLSPFGKMPVLEFADGASVFESTSIIDWLERDTRVLLPEQPELERRARHFDRLGDLYLIDAQTSIWFRPGTEEAQAAERTAATALKLFEGALEQGPFICGGAFSLGDLSGAIGVDYLQRLGVSLPPRVSEWRARCFAVPAMAAAIEPALPIIEQMLAKRAAGMGSA